MRYRVKVVPGVGGYVGHIYVKSLLLWSRCETVFAGTVESAARRAKLRVQAIEFIRTRRA